VALVRGVCVYVVMVKLAVHGCGGSSAGMEWVCAYGG